MNQEKFFPIIVVGGGHAGCEAALAASRMGIPTLLVSLNLSAIALMPCNPSIGGPGKGHLVREIGALGGEMANAIDETCIQIKWLNTSRGPAVQARRAQADKRKYHDRMIRLLLSTPNLTVREGKVVQILTKNDKVTGIKLETGIEFYCEKLIIATGTYLSSRIIIGPRSWEGGPHNQRSSPELANSLRNIGISLRRLQTATPPRVHRSSVDFSKVQELPGDRFAGGFSWKNRKREIYPQKSCYLTFTTPATIKAVKKHIQNSPLVLANITNDGPKHCPSIDRKVLKFPDMTKHQIFIEPETEEGYEMYLQGLTTSMPPEAQREIIRTVPGLESAKILRYGYAIEYDALAPGLIKKTMASRRVEGLFTAGQINGTSGYEEAAAQGLIAGINAALAVQGKGELIPSRTESYIGVLVDDLSMWEHPEPYRITPFFAEFRLSLREETAEARLLEIGCSLGLIKQDLRSEIVQWINRIKTEIDRLENFRINPSKHVLDSLSEAGVGGLKKQVSLADILRRPNVYYRDLPKFAGADFSLNLTEDDEIKVLENEIKYRGYAERERERIEETKLLESIRLPLTKLPKSWNLISNDLKKDLQSNNFDDLSQLSKKRCLSRNDLAILLADLKHN